MISLTYAPIIAVMLTIRERQMSHESLNYRNRFDYTYDYIVVGAGSAGSIVAYRLAEDRTKTVLLLEAGGPQTVWSDIPALLAEQTGTELDWAYPNVPQKYSYLAYIGNQVDISRGRAFGGSSIHNSMNYYRENREFFRLWSDVTGVRNWTFDDVLPFFLKSENNTDFELVAENPRLHRSGGRLTITTAKPDPILTAYVMAANLLGYPPTHQDGRQPFGTTIMQRNIKDGVRQSTSLAFLEHNMSPNLHILGDSLVTRILFNDKKRAIGIEYYRSNAFHKCMARKEVVVSAGAIGSPKLLMMSGIGPKDHLERMDIPVIADLKVGHFVRSSYVELYFDVNDQSLVEKPIENFKNFYNYFVRHTGPLAYKASGITCFKQKSYPNYPGLSNGCVSPRTDFLGNDLENLVKNFKLKDKWREYYRPYLNRTYFGMLSILRRPKSVGTIRLASNNPFEHPLIDPCHFCVPQDLTDLVDIFKLSLDIYTSQLLRPVIQVYRNPIPGCKPCSGRYFCDSYIRCILQTITLYTAPVGGCRIGIPSDSSAVVDQELRVFGVSALRVIDSSIFPVSAEQTNAITIMIGEYGAHLVNRSHL